MKKIFTFCLMAVAVMGLQAKVYTFADLSNIENSGVTYADGVFYVNVNADLTEPMELDNGGITVSKTDLTLADGNGLRIEDGITVLFGEKARITMNGKLDADLENGATLSATEEAAGNAIGIRLIGEESDAVLTNVTFQYIGIGFGGSLEKGSFVAKNCEFLDFNGKLANANINFTAMSKGNLIKDCTFSNGLMACVASGANTPVGITIEGCVMDKNGTQGRLTPAINMTVGMGGTEDVNILNNEVIGREVTTRAGGISVANLLGLAYSGTVNIKGNVVKYNSFGIACTGPFTSVIEDNTSIDNHYIADPNNGGSGINITANTGGAVARIHNNYVEGNCWGVTLIGIKRTDDGDWMVPENAISVDMGTEDEPGGNVFVDNGNKGVLYDLYNNSAFDVPARGNTWNVDDQNDLEAIEDVIVHQVDNEMYGLVDFAPLNSGITDVKAATVTDGRYYNLMGQPVANPTSGIYIHNGVKVVIR